MLIPLIIGKNSNGENQTIDLSNTPLLMISYCEEEQLANIFSQLQSLTYPFKKNDYYISSKRKFDGWKLNNHNAFTFFKDEPEEGNVKSRVKLLNDEISNRERILKKKKITDFKRYYSFVLSFYYLIKSFRPYFVDYFANSQKFIFSKSISFCIITPIAR